ncbi:MAG: TetR/AcrR family transcriptional regulator [Gemmobacter sp.]
MQPADTRQRLIAATEAVICRERAAPGVTSRAIAAEAGVRLSAIGYHFGSLEALVVATAERVARRLNTERLTALQQAVDRHRPAPPPIDLVIEALVGPSVRWSLDPASAYPVFDYAHRMHALTARPELYHGMTEAIGHHIAFIAVLRRAAPWLGEAEIGWRINAALGIRSQVIRNRHRSRVLAAGSVDFDDPESVIARMVEVIAPMFARTEPPARVHPRPLPRIRTAT